MPHEQRDSGRGPDIDPRDVFEPTVGTLILDVRDQDEWDRGHQDGAVHMPLAQLDPDGLDRSRPVITVCRSGRRSDQAADQLAAAGLNVRNMAGGLNAWDEQGLPLIRDDGTPGAL